MKLFAGAVVVVEGDDGFGSAVEVGPVGFDFDFGYEKLLAVMIDHPLDDLEGDGNARTFFVLFAGAQMVDEADVDVLSFTTLYLLSDAAGVCEPLLRALIAQVALYDEVVVAKSIKVVPGVVSAVETEEALAVESELPEHFRDTLYRFGRAGLAVLAARPQFAVEHVPFGADIGEHGRETVVFFVGKRHALLGRAGVVERADIHIGRNQFKSVGVHAAEGALAQQLKVEFTKRRMSSIGRKIIETGAEYRLGSDGLQPISIHENGVIAIEVDVVEICSGIAAKADLGHQNIAIGDGIGTPRLEVLGKMEVR